MKNIKAICNERFALQQEYLGKKKIVNTIEPLVSVTVTTYQHAPYIMDCLKGILMQKTIFPFEIIIGDDESTDGTREICIEFAAKHPDKVRLFLRERKISQLIDENDGIVTIFNGIWTKLSARGKYIAWCDGDDYWTDPFKLQKQVSFLEDNEDYVLCFHDSIVVDKSNKVISNSCFNNECSDYCKDILLAGPGIPTNTALFRNIIDYPEFYFKVQNEDIAFWHLLGFHGGGKFIANINNSVYRHHDEGLWSSLSKVEKIKSLIASRTVIKNNIIMCKGYSHNTVTTLNRRIRILRLKYLYQYIKKIPFVGHIIRNLVGYIIRNLRSHKTTRSYLKKYYKFLLLVFVFHTTIIFFRILYF
ncbi:MAG: glycosyltransferase [Candidatus Neomarinimicrobiota bacterium]